MSTEVGVSARRELSAAVLLCLVGSSIVLFALGQTWVSYGEAGQITIGTPRTEVHGATLVPAARALGYVGLAGVLALAATRRWGRVLLGLLLLAAGLGIVVTIGGALSDGLAARVPYTCPGTGTRSCLTPLRSFQRTASGWAWAALVGAVMVTLAGLLVTVRGRRWAALSSAYEAPSPAPSAAPDTPVTDKGVWDALDRGEDPTA